MKQFRFKYAPLVWALLIVVILVSLVGLAWNIFNVIVTKESGFKLISYWIVILLTAFILVLAISIAVYGKYKIKNGYLYSFFGFISNKIEIKEIVEVVHFKKSDKLVIYTQNNAYQIIVIAPEFYDDFVLSLREQNSKIKFDIKIDGEDAPN